MPRPSVTIRIWSLPCVCQAVCAPRRKWDDEGAQVLGEHAVCAHLAERIGTNVTPH